MPKTCGELLVELLEGYGVDTVFGIPGVHTVELYRGLPQTQIKHITPRHEQGAGFMADGYARVTGKPGVCFIITGPGMTNMLTAMAQARADSIPMLVISSVNATATLGGHEGRLHELPNQAALIAQVALYSRTVWQPEALPNILAEAFTRLNSGRKGPVHIQLPIDVITKDASAVPAAIASLPQPEVIAPATLTAVTQMLATAQAPLLLLGGGCSRLAPALVQAFVKYLDLPTMLTVNAKGLLPPAHALSLGSRQSTPLGRELIKRADVVLAVGTELGETDYDTVFDGGFAINGKLIRVDCDARQLNVPVVADVAVLGDAGAFMQQILATPLAFDFQSAAKVATLKQLFSAEERQNMALTAQNALLKLIRETLPKVVIVGDSTQPVYAGNEGYEAAAPNTWFNSSTGYGTLGYALPAAIGAQLGKNAPVVCLIGDGGIQFTLPELMVAVEAQLPLIVLIWHNQGYGEIRRYMENAHIAPIGVDVAAPDFAHIAAAYHAGYERITSGAQLIASLQQASEANAPTLLEIHEDDYFLNEIISHYSYFE